MEFQIAAIIALVLSIVLHEVAHGHAANWLGDPTARLQGRLSLNPLVHIDPMGSVIIPGLLFLSGTPLLFGWAKPVPYNPYNLRNQRWGEAMVAAAGPAVNLLLAVIFAVLIRMSGVLNLSQSFIELASAIVLINVLLALFNMIPFPPLDGSKILVAFLPYQAQLQYQRLIGFVEQYGIFAMFAFIFAFIYFFSDPFFVVIYYIVGLLTGQSVF
jgi:Zn-dependent protease